MTLVDQGIPRRDLRDRADIFVGYGIHEIRR